MVGHLILMLFLSRVFIVVPIVISCGVDSLKELITPNLVKITAFSGSAE